MVGGTMVGGCMVAGNGNQSGILSPFLTVYTRLRMRTMLTVTRTIMASTRSRTTFVRR